MRQLSCNVVLLVLLMVPAMTWAGGDRLRKHDGSVLIGDLVEAREKSIVIAPEGAGPEDRVEVSYRDLNAIKFRNREEDAQSTRILIDNRGQGKSDLELTSTIKLRSGKHRVGLAFWHKTGPTTLKLEYSGPQIKRTKIAASQWSHPGVNAQRTRDFTGWDAEGFLVSEEFTPVEKGVQARVHEFGLDTDMEDFADFKGIRVARYAVANNLDLGAFRHSNTHYAVVIQGYLQVPADGEYTFYLKSSNDLVLWVGKDPGSVHPGSQALQGEHFSVLGADGGAWWGALRNWTRETLSIEVTLGGQSQSIDAAIPYIQELWSTPAVLKTVKVDRTGESSAVDSIYVKSADGNTIQRVNGLVLGREGDSLQVEYEGEKRGLKMERLVGVVFQGRRTVDRPAQGVLLVAGDIRLPGRIVEVARARPLTFQTAWGQTIVWPYDRVVRYDVRNGRNTWLTDLTPQSIEQTPYFERHLGWSTDKSLTGTELKLAEKTYPRGLCLHSRTVLSYDLSGDYQQFQSDLGLQHVDGQLGRASVRVLLDGQTAFENRDLTQQTGRQELSLDVKDKKSLTLEVDFGENFDVGDHVTFGNPRLVRNSE